MLTGSSTRNGNKFLIGRGEPSACGGPTGSADPMSPGEPISPRIPQASAILLLPAVSCTLLHSGPPATPAAPAIPQAPAIPLGPPTRWATAAPWAPTAIPSTLAPETTSVICGLKWVRPAPSPAIGSAPVAQRPGRAARGGRLQEREGPQCRLLQAVPRRDDIPGFRKREWFPFEQAASARPPRATVLPARARRHIPRRDEP